jgi:hypothetical protein
MWPSLVLFDFQANIPVFFDRMPFGIAAAGDIGKFFMFCIPLITEMLGTVSIYSLLRHMSLKLTMPTPHANGWFCGVCRMC